eukprot:3751061-Rhodomonas_salina.2
MRFLGVGFLEWVSWNGFRGVHGGHEERRRAVGDVAEGDDLPLGAGARGEEGCSDSRSRGARAGARDRLARDLPVPEARGLPGSSSALLSTAAPPVPPAASCELPPLRVPRPQLAPSCLLEPAALNTECSSTCPPRPTAPLPAPP